jgi:hypothetical protein
VSTSSIVSNRHAHSCSPRVDACSHLTMARRLLTALFRAHCRVKAQHDKASPLTPEVRRRRMQRRSLSSWDLCRLGILMEPDLADPREAKGVLNPAVARGPRRAPLSPAPPRRRPQLLAHRPRTRPLQPGRRSRRDGAAGRGPGAAGALRVQLPDLRQHTTRSIRAARTGVARRKGDPA